MQDLKLALIQSDIYWQDPSANLEMLEKKINRILKPIDVIILPEMFNTGFTMDSNFAETMDSITFSWMSNIAKKKNAVLMGSFIVKDEGNIYNRLVWVQPNGEYSTYDKRHLFRMADEHDHFNFGKKQAIVEWRGWNIMLQVCYDLRFPVWARNKSLEYDAILYIANWPAARISAWDTLLKARAIENLSYSIGLNRVGMDGKRIEYNGHSAVYNPKGETLAFSDTEEILYQELDADELKTYRAKFPAHLDADNFDIHR